MPVYPGRFTNRHRTFAIILLLIIALLLPVYAPWLNPGYAAAQADHSHIYLGAVDIDHHAHSPAPYRHNAAKQDTTPEEVDLLPGVIMLPNLSVARQNLPLLPVTGSLASWIEQSGVGTLSFSLGAAFVGVMLVYLSRPVPPPRLSP